MGAQQHQTSSLFSLPAELRLQIYEHAMPSRILQMGYDFPFPFLPINPEVDTHSCATTAYTTIPNLFHLCHEARSVCLSIYVPFAYTYLHPIRDTIYISRQALMVLVWQCQELCSIKAVARPPLYPMGKIRRLIVEYDFNDTISWGLSPLRRLLLIFGMPEELLLTLGDSRESHVLKQLNSGHTWGWEELRFLDDSKLAELDNRRETEQRMREYIQRDFVVGRYSFWNRPQYNSWSDLKKPEIKLVDIAKRGYVSRTEDDAMELREPLKRISEDWIQAEKGLFKYGKHSEGLLYTYGSGLLYTKENTERALEWARKGKPVLA